MGFQKEDLPRKRSDTTRWKDHAGKGKIISKERVKNGTEKGKTVFGRNGAPPSFGKKRRKEEEELTNVEQPKDTPTKKTTSSEKEREKPLKGGWGGGGKGGYNTKKELKRRGRAGEKKTKGKRSVPRR